MNPAVEWLEQRTDTVLAARDEMRTLMRQNDRRVRRSYTAWTQWLETPAGQARRRRIQELSDILKQEFHLDSMVRRRMFELVPASSSGDSARWPNPHPQDDLGYDDDQEYGT